MRIAVYAKVLSETKPNGIGVYVHNLLKALAHIDKKNEYVLYSNEPIAHGITAPNFREKIVDFPRSWFYLRFPLEFVSGGYDLLFIPMAKVPPLIRPKTVCVFYGFGKVKEDRLSMGHRLHIWMAGNYSLKKADGVIAISESAKKDLIENFSFDPGKITMTHLGYDDKLYRRCLDKALIEKVKSAYGVGGGYIMNTSSVLWSRKNLLRLIKAFAVFRKKSGSGHKLLITGRKGESYAEMVGLINSLSLNDDVILTEYIPAEEMPVLLSGADCMVFPSLHEGFGLSVLEAMACGCPVVTSNVSSLPEVIGGAGALVDPYNVEETAAAIEKVLGDRVLREKMSKAGQERAKTFTWEDTARKTLGVFERLGNPCAS